ncbi:MAG: PEP-CTERM sorting domain-containing protein [Planctomycetes bacterium]|nr:PEP-CTERM sorting domain-containing protein [Planctomycetota bacterium]
MYTRNVLLVVCIVSGLSVGISSARGDIVFSVTQSSPAASSPLQLGSANAGLFDVFIRSTTANQQLLGVDFTLRLSATNGAGGRFVSGQNVLMQNSSNPEGFIPGTFSGAGAVTATFSTIQNTSNILIGTSNVLLARLSLSTVNAAAGSYSMSLSGVDAIDFSFNQIPSSVGGSLSYSAVPEPSAMLLTLLGISGLAWRNRMHIKRIHR